MVDTSELVYTVLEVVIAVACCLGNLLVILAVWRCGAIRRQPTYCFIISLAVADFLVGAVAVPLRVLVDSRVQMSFYSCLASCCGVIFLARVSVFSQLALAIDRFLRVTIPLRYKTTVTLQRCWWAVAACWVLGASAGFIPLMGWNNRTNMSHSSWSECQFLNVMSSSYLVYIYFYVCFIIPMLVMAILYYRIFTLIHHQLRSISTGMSHSYYHKERKLARSLVLVLVLFAVCWLPIHLVDTASFYGTKYTVPLEVVYVAILLFQANSAINPVIYALKIHPIRAALKLIWRRFLLCKEEEEAPVSSQTPGTDASSNPRKTRLDKEKSAETIEQDESSV